MEKKYKPLFHISPQKGWINDPNGFSFAFGKYHLFAQHNPYKPEWGPMHWLHFTSNDLVKFTNVGIALKPDAIYDLEFGCFSGSAYYEKGMHYLFYTGVNEGKQQQCIAWSNDGVNYIKAKENPFIKGSDLPPNYSGADFRDPFVFKHESWFYFLISAKKISGGSSILTYRTRDFLVIEFIGITKDTSIVNEMIECPALTFIDGQALLVYSLQFKKEKLPFSHQNIHANVYEVGTFNFETGLFVSKSGEKEIDFGFDFYAPQLLTHNNHHYLVAWQNMWEQNNPSAKDGYAGHLTMVREIKIANERLMQYFVPALTNYYDNELIYKNININSSKLFNVENAINYRLELVLNVKEEACIAFDVDELTTLTLDPKTQSLTFRRSGFINNARENANERTIQIAESFNNLILDIVQDGNALTVLINTGQYAFSMIYYTNSVRKLKIMSTDTIIKLFNYHALVMKED